MRKKVYILDYSLNPKTPKPSSKQYKCYEDQ